MIDLSKLNLEELIRLKADAEREIQNRSNTTTKKIIYKTTFSDSSKNHLAKYKHWAKVITNIDTTKPNGYAFIGEWLNKTGENLLNEGSYVIELDDDVKYTLYQIYENKINRLVEGTQKELITFIYKCNNIINGSEIDDELKD